MPSAELFVNDRDRTLHIRLASTCSRNAATSAVNLMSAVETRLRHFFVSGSLLRDGRERKPSVLAPDGAFSVLADNASVWSFTRPCLDSDGVSSLGGGSAIWLSGASTNSSSSASSSDDDSSSATLFDSGLPVRCRNPDPVAVVVPGANRVPLLESLGSVLSRGSEAFFCGASFESGKDDLVVLVLSILPDLGCVGEEEVEETFDLTCSHTNSSSSMRALESGDEEAYCRIEDMRFVM